MKKIVNLTWVLLLSLIAVSCTDLSSIYGRIDELEARVNKLEDLMKNARTRIEALQGLIDAEAGKKFIKEWIEKPYGYDLIMSDGSTLSLMNGRNGKTPNVSVTEMNGTLYWTIDGELMRDAQGQPIRAKAEDGKMPRVQITGDGYWQISTDDGATWKDLRDENGERVRAKGLDATHTLSITETDAAIIIVFGGKTFTISKVAGGGGSQPGVFDPNKMAIEYVSEYGVAKDGKSFASAHTADVLGVFAFNDATALFAESFLVGKYHFPSASEWLGIVPQSSNISFTSESVKTGVVEKIKVGKDQVEKDYTAEYKSVSNGIAYGIKFIDKSNTMRTAYRYQVVGLLKDSNDAYLKVTARLIGADAKITLDTIADEAFWNKDKAKNKERVFPAAGYQKGTKVNLGTQGFYPASDAYATSGFNKYKVQGLELDQASAKIHRSVLLGNTDKYKFTIRPFSDF